MREKIAKAIFKTAHNHKADGMYEAMVDAALAAIETEGFLIVHRNRLQAKFSANEIGENHDAVEHAGKHADCQHTHFKKIRTGKKQCELCGCIIYETYADYVG